MGRKGIYDNWKYRKNFYKYGTKRISDDLQSNVAEDVSIKTNRGSIKYNYDEDMFLKGRKWCEEGFKLEEAPNDMRSNVSFVAGYDKERRLMSINQQLYDLGREYYEKGTLLENYRQSKFFVDGYNDSSRGMKK